MEAGSSKDSTATTKTKAKTITPSLKRKYENEDEEESKPVCRYGCSCYQKNAKHLEEFSHPNDTPVKRLKHDETVQSEIPFYLATVQGIDKQFNKHDISIKDILSMNRDEFLESCQFNYMFDIPWLMNKYPNTSRSKPLLIVHGHTGSDKLNLQSDALKYKNIDLVQAKLPIMYGTHHTKMMFLLYTTGCRVVIHTANLIEQDWLQKTQGIWLSPLFTSVATVETDKIDEFKKDLSNYISSYGSLKLSKLMDKLKRYDMTSAGVHIIASIPGRHSGREMNKWGHLRLKKILSEHGPDVETMKHDCPVIAQFSSVGSLGTEASKWLTSEWLQSLSQCKCSTIKRPTTSNKAMLKLIFPTMENVRNCLEGYSAGGSLPFSAENATKQRWMREYLCQWVAASTGRSLASPHIKTYARLSRDQQSAAWFLLTSANLSKAAWGMHEKNSTQLMIRSYEIGVLFTPNHKNGETCYNINSNNKEDPTIQPYLRLPYDVPVTPYKSTDKPWIWNIRYTKEDSHGKLWVP